MIKIWNELSQFLVWHEIRTIEEEENLYLFNLCLGESGPYASVPYGVVDSVLLHAYASLVYLSLWTFSYSSACTKLLTKRTYSCISSWATEKVNNLIQHIDLFYDKRSLCIHFHIFAKIKGFVGTTAEIRKLKNLKEVK